MNIPNRAEVNPRDCWDLSSLYPNTEEWEEDLAYLESQVPKLEKYRGLLSQSAEKLSEALQFFLALDQKEERLAYYAHLKIAEDLSNSESTQRYARLMSLSTKMAALSSYVSPEIQSIDPERMEDFLLSPHLEDYQIYLRKKIRMRDHVLGEEGERILALGQESQSAVQKAFSNLTNVDFVFGDVETPEGPKALSQSSFSVFLQSPEPEIRERAYKQFYQEFKDHQHGLSSLITGRVQQMVFLSRARKHSSAREMALYPDKVPTSVYDNLIKVVREHLPLLHSYYSFRKEALGLEKLKHWDVYAPITAEADKHTPYEEGVEMVIDSLSPLGSSYTDTLRNGLLKGWVDRYENKGKRSGAFSAGSFFGDPYILLNYKENNIRDLFTLTHEAGHSMHSWYSSRNNPFSHYNYTIFEAEVASTFNEQLLAQHLKKKNQDNPLFLEYLEGKLLDDTVATLFRQTMFAEFEHLIHKEIEEGKGLSLESLRAIYAKLQEDYFGADVELGELASLECLRIPHFYSPFYVYKYATGLSAAMTLSKMVLEGGITEREQYIRFLKAGGSHYPLESLKMAGVEMSKEEPIREAMAIFSLRLEELKKLKSLG